MGICVPDIPNPIPNPSIDPFGFKQWCEDMKLKQRQERLDKLKWKRRFFLISKSDYEAEVFSEYL